MSVVHVRELAPTVRLALGLEPVPARVWPGEAAAKEGEDALRPILALDLGTRTGWALRWDEGHVASGVEDFGGQHRRESLVQDAGEEAQRVGLVQVADHPAPPRPRRLQHLGAGRAPAPGCVALHGRGQGRDVVAPPLDLGQEHPLEVVGHGAVVPGGVDHRPFVDHQRRPGQAQRLPQPAPEPEDAQTQGAAGGGE